MRDELDSMRDVLLGRVEPPLPAERVETMMEVANAYYARGMEMTELIQRAETQGVIIKGSKHYKFRTGELRTFCDACKSVVELGSRRITVVQIEQDEMIG